MRVHFSSQAFDYQTLRSMAYTTFGGAEPGEVLVTADRIDDRDTESWHTEWLDTAERLEQTAATAADAGNERTARGAYLRAHTYLRTAEFFLPTDDVRRQPTYERSREAFRAGIDLFDIRVERFHIPYEDAALPGYLFVPPTGPGPHRTVVCLGGFDSLAEELYFLCGVPEALDRGYAVVLFDGPGQGAPLRYHGITARPDWEHVVGPVLDELEQYDASVSSAVGLIGVSFGGYYAPRAAAFDDRIAACVAFDHMHDLWRAAAADSPRMARWMLSAPDSVVNGLATIASRMSVESRWLLANGMWVFGVNSAAAFQREIRHYSLSPIAQHIDCPTLVLAGADDHFVPVGLAREFVDELGGPATLRVFETDEGAGEHCQVGNLSLATGVIYDWLDDSPVQA